MFKDRTGEEKLNNQGCLMKIIEYNDFHNIIVEFQDEYQLKVHTEYRHFKNGQVKNSYYPSVYRVGIIGDKHSDTKEYRAWSDILRRCYDEKYKKRKPTYKSVTCCKEWLFFPNFYEWIHSQTNFDKWANEDKWTLDKDILIKGNKIYSPETCCLVHNNINVLFTKRDNHRGNLPIGVTKAKDNKRYHANCCNPFINKSVHLGIYNTPEEAFYAYKKYKENIIKQVAQEEYDKGNITKPCYEAMMKYEVEITD